MGTWLNVAFVQTDDLGGLERQLAELFEARGRQRIHPLPRVPQPFDPMQYGKDDDVSRWAVAGFRGAPGWTVLRTAPFQLLLRTGLLTRLGAPAFQYNVYDGDSHFLFEAAGGRIEKSGFVGSDPAQHWNGDPPEDRLEARFHLLDVEPAAAWAQKTMPQARVTGWLPSYRRNDLPRSPVEEALVATLEQKFAERRRALLRWLETCGGEVGDGFYRVHPAHVVRALGESFLSIEGVVDSAICQVFGGANSEYCDNRFLVEVLVPHAPLPTKGFVLYVE